ncbi:MAG: choline-sulfatase [Candidatus Puniceispirillales bacterium]
MMTGQPNILFVQTDQLTIDVLATYGHPIARTPHIDALAEDGTVFDVAYCNFPLCAPSRMSMATGLLASRVGAYDNATEFPATIPSYAHYMRHLGYRTCLSGKMHFVGPDQLHGFERRLTTDIYPSDFAWTPDWSSSGFHGATDTSVLTDSGVCRRNVQIDYDEDVTHKAVQEIYDAARAADGRPFFLQVSYTHPHDPYLCLQEHWDRYDGVEIPMPKTGMIPHNENDPHSLRVLRQHGFDAADVPDEAIARARRAYCGSVSYIDDHLGRLLNAVEESGQTDNTIVVFTSDHGEMLGERGLWLKKTFFESALRVPLIIKAPGLIAQGRVETPVSLLDLLPSFAGMATGGEWPGAVEPLDGDNLMDIAANPDPGRPVYAELLSEGILAPIFMIRRGNYKLITSKGDPDLLYDVVADPQERHNMADDPAHAETLAALRTEAEEKWDSDGLSEKIVLSQRRRHLVRAAHSQGIKPFWDYDLNEGDELRYYRGDGNYNDWAMDYLPHPSRQKPE